MELILWRHAEAEDGYPDMERALTAKGQRQAAQMGKWLDARLPSDCQVLVSPARRTLQTVAGLPRPHTVLPALAPGVSTPEQILDAAGWPHGEGSVLLVGHQPTLGMVAALVLAGTDRDWTVRRGNAWWFQRRGRWGDDEVLLKAVMAPELV